MQSHKRSADGSRKTKTLEDDPAVHRISEMLLDDLGTFIVVADRPLVKTLIASFTRWVVFLPASQNNHHSEPFGLFLHSAMVTIRLFDRIGAIPTGLTNLDTNERREWILAGMAAALLHDCGKVLDMEVRLSKSGEIWDPLEQSLVDFVSDKALEPQNMLIKFIAGRGLKGHEPKGRALIPLILPSAFTGDLTTKTLAIYDACASHHMINGPMAHSPAAWLAALILTSDREDCAMDLRLRREGRLLEPFQVGGN